MQRSGGWPGPALPGPALWQLCGWRSGCSARLSQPQPASAQTLWQPSGGTAPGGCHLAARLSGSLLWSVAFSGGLLAALWRPARAALASPWPRCGLALLPALASYLGFPPWLSALASRLGFPPWLAALAGLLGPPWLPAWLPAGLTQQAPQGYRVPRPKFRWLRQTSYRPVALWRPNLAPAVVLPLCGCRRLSGCRLAAWPAGGRRSGNAFLLPGPLVLVAL